MKTLVALVDFSDAAFKLLKHAHKLARAFESRVVLMHIVPAQPVVMDFMVSPTILEPPSPETVRTDLEKLLMLQESLSRHGVETETRQFHGAGLPEVLAECEALRADLIILGSHGHGSFYNLLIGSMTAEVLKKARCPVLVVPVDENDPPSS